MIYITRSKNRQRDSGYKKSENVCFHSHPHSIFETPKRPSDSIFLPDNWTLFDSPEELISGLNVGKSGIKFRHVINHAIYPDFCGRVFIGFYLFSQRLIAYILSPYLCISEEEPLVIGKSIYWLWCFLTFER